MEAHSNRTLFVLNPNPSSPSIVGRSTRSILGRHLGEWPWMNDWIISLHRSRTRRRARTGAWVCCCRWRPWRNWWPTHWSPWSAGGAASAHRFYSAASIWWPRRCSTPRCPATRCWPLLELCTASVLPASTSPVKSPPPSRRLCQCFGWFNDSKHSYLNRATTAE